MAQDRNALKRAAGVAAAELVRDGMVVGLGTGSTVEHTIVEIGRRMKARELKVSGVPTSEASARLAREAGIPLTTLDDHPALDIAIDGADEFDPQFRLIKGGGGALTREKVVAHAARRMVVVADAAKEVARLGSTFPLPVEVIPFARTPVRDFLTGLGASVALRTAPGGSPFVTDNGNSILDAKWSFVADPEELERALQAQPGVVCSGLFLDLCDTIYVARPSGVATLRRDLAPDVA
ncbi:MAG: ribose-5-phosphate isomerase RpiA [Thermoplasmatota archaeon]